MAQLLKCQQIGLRALGFAFREDLNGSSAGNLESAAQDLVWIRFIAIEDPIRADVPAAVQACHRAGIDVKIITGDHPETAKEIGRQIGVLDSSTMTTGHLTGMEFEKLSPEEAERRIDSIKVLSRSRPGNKKQFVELLRRKGHVVAVTGDGVNDCPALSHADVGLAMGSGTDAAKEVSQIVLLNDSFATIRSAVMWGRSLYQNIQRFILFQLTVNVAALTVALLGPFLGIKFPLTVVQMLWVNLIMDTFAALALAAEPPHEDVMSVPPRRPADFIVTKGMAKNIAVTGMAFVVVLVGYLLHIRRTGVVLSDDVPSRELTILFVLFVMLQFWNLFNARTLGLKGSALSGFWKNSGFLLIVTAIFVGTVLMVQFGGNVFRTVPLSLWDWVVLVAGTSLVLWIGELGRLYRRSSAKA
jgi:Ca2+-transporting ATPase